jgi:polyvinyl alcohol dehydrogenase (cytochrome)
LRPGASCPERIGPDFDLATSPMLTTMANGRDILVIGQKSGDAWGMDPENNGAILWRYTATETGSTSGGIMWAEGTDGDQAYFGVTSADLPQPGGLHAVRLDTGKRAWYTPPAPPKCERGPRCNGGQATPLAIIPGVVFSGSYDGAMRAFSTSNGALVWEFDTNRRFATVNGVTANGGGIGAQGPTIVEGMLYFNSGGGSNAARPGNVLLAFGVE